MLPRRPDASSASRLATLSVKRVLEFSSQTLRSGVVVSSSDEPLTSALLFLRGAPAAVKSLVDAASIPPDFDQVCVSVSVCLSVCLLIRPC